MQYNELINKIRDLKNKVDFKLIGKSLFGEEIYVFHVGEYSGKQIFLSGGIHAREYISSLFLIKEIEYLSNRELSGGIYILPLINPDGVRLVLESTDFIADEKLRRFLIDLNGSENFSLWKANGNAVDLNVNFDAKWGEGKNNRKKLGRENFIGYYPNSEIENINIINFLKETKIDLNIAFHSKGEVIYYGFEKSKEQLKKEEKIVKLISSFNGYIPIKSVNSTGGLSDYIAQKYDVPSMTVELGSDFLNHPITERYLNYIFQTNKDVPIEVLKFISN